MTASVLIVDDHPLFRTVAGNVLRAGGFEVVGEAADGTSAIAAVRAKRPDVVLLDIGLPDIDGFEVARVLLADGDPPQIVLVSTRPASAYGPRLRSIAARGFIQKDELSGAALSALV